jgi:hypothetical protein
MPAFRIVANKTYASEANAIKAAEAKFGEQNLRYFIMTEKDEITYTTRYFPVFVGEAAIRAGVHFHFNVIG